MPVARPPVVSQREWDAALAALSEREEAVSVAMHELAAARKHMPMVRVEHDYEFEGPDGRRSLAELFDGRSQLITYHFMLGPGWAAGCPGCSFLSDHFDGALPHLEHHDVTLTAVARAPLPEIEAYKERMGWQFPWVSSYGNDFNYDYHVSFRSEDLASGKVIYNFAEMPVPAGSKESELPGMSAFYKDDTGNVFHTYSSYARGPEEWIGTLMILDRAPKGRNEKRTMDFVRRHDEYETKAARV